MRVVCYRIKYLFCPGAIYIILLMCLWSPDVAEAGLAASVDGGQTGRCVSGCSGTAVTVTTPKLPDMRAAVGASSIETGQKIAIPSHEARIMALTRPQEGVVQQLALLLDGQLTDLIDGKYRASFIRLPGSLQKSFRSTKALTALFASGKAQRERVIPAVIEAATHLSNAMNEIGGYAKDGKIKDKAIKDYPILQYLHAFVAILAGGTYPKNAG